MSLVLVLLPSASFATEPKPQLELSGDEAESHTHAESHTKAETSEYNLVAQDEDPPLSEEKTTPSSIEQFVQPFTRWAEDQIHNTGLIRAPQVTEDEPPLKHESMTLRAAIQHATQRYPGTVLSAKKVLSEEALSYQIKIISKQGRVKTIKITESHETHQGIQ